MTISNFIHLVDKAKFFLAFVPIENEQDQVDIDKIELLLKSDLTTHNALELEKIVFKIEGERNAKQRP